MSTSLSTHSKVLAVVRKGNPREDRRRQCVFAWLVTGMLMAESVSLPRLSLVIGGDTQASSRLRRLHRFLNNPRVSVEAYYRPFIVKVLQRWANQDVLVAIDTTSPKGKCAVCRIALVYRDRAIPLVWRSFETQSHSLSFSAYEPLLAIAAELLSDTRSVTLLGDRGFGNTQLMLWCRRRGWHFALRIKRSRKLKLASGRPARLSDYAVAPGDCFGLSGVTLSGRDARRLGAIQIFVAQSDKPDAETWYIASDRPDGCAVIAAYAMRMSIEHSFRDDKSGGFDWEDSHLVEPEQVDRLLLVMAVATLYLVSLGVAIVEDGLRKLYDPHSQRGLSYFQIGLRVILATLAQGRRIRLRLDLSPAPDPEPLSHYEIPFAILGRFTWLPGHVPAGL